LPKHYKNRSEAVQPVAKSWGQSEWNLERERSHRAFMRLASGIAIASQNGKSANREVRDFLGDPKVRLSAALRAIGGQPEPAEAFGLRNRINLWESSDSSVTWYPKKKANGGYRPICILPPVLKAAHFILATVISSLLPDTNTLYGIPRRGVADALRELKAHQNAGFDHLAKADIVNCFQSVAPDALYQLPLPMEVIRQTLDYRNLTFTMRNRQYASQAFGCTTPLVYGLSHKASGPTGLLQGSPASNIILAWLLKDVPTSDDAKVMLCFDNIVVAARSPAGSRQMMETLTAYLRQSPAGPLALCEPTFADKQPMEFLGGLFDPARRDIGIAHDTLSRIERRLGEAEEFDQAELGLILEEYLRLAAENAIYRASNPFQSHYPTGIWHALRDTFAGLSFLEAGCPELMILLETAAMTVDWRGDGRISHLHRSLFAPAGTQEAATLRHILRSRPRHTKRKG
jgi:hypothetical protein